MANNKLELYSLYQLHDNKILCKNDNTETKVKYYIDSYQRGYRWDQKQINLLLDDLWEFHQKYKDKLLKPNEYYCLQPIVVKPKTIENSTFCWEVLDGQQRLTSLKILISYLLDQTSQDLDEEYAISNFDIVYKTRDLSQDYLSGISHNYCTDKKNDNIDFYYMSNAYIAIVKWFEDKNIVQKREKRDFLDQLLASEDRDNPIKVIWYEVNDDTDSYDIFTRLNIGKIKLTNSELIKALFLRNLDSKESEGLLALNEIANDWNNLENKLQKDEFWYFLFNPNNLLNYPNRLEYIFDLYCERTKDSEEYHTFFRINESFLEGNTVKDRMIIWQDFKAYFLKLEGWFIDIKFYHYIGFLIATGYSILDVIALSEGKNKDEFIQVLQKKIKERINCTEDDLRDLKYNNKQIYPILLLFNIVTIASDKKSNYRFPFHLFKSQHWDIEHIRSKNDKVLNKDEEWRSWIKDMVEYFTSKDIDQEFERDPTYNNSIVEQFSLEELHTDVQNELTKMIIAYKEDNIQKSVLQLSFSFFRSYFKEDTDDLDKDSIGNLSLLDAYTNRSYGNAFYTLKRQRIQQNGKYGLFTPVCTTNAFMKVYSRKLENLNYWSIEDAESYTEEIINVLKPYLKPTING